MKVKTIKIVVLLMVLGQCRLMAFAPINFFPPYDPHLRLVHDARYGHCMVGTNVECAYGSYGFNKAGEKVNILHIYEPNQAVIPMLMQPVNNPAAVEFLNAITSANSGPALDNGVRGHIVMGGKARMTDVTLQARGGFSIDLFPGNIGLSIMVPVRHARVHEICFNDLTQSSNAADLDIKALTGNEAVFKSKVKELGNLDLNAWCATGVGDVVIMLDWSHNFLQQNKRDLKSVELNAKLGLSCPSGRKKDEDKAFSLALGNDGAWALPFGLGMRLDFYGHVRVGIDAEVTFLFDSTKERRMKTAEHQTAFLLLNKELATMSHGVEWKFYLYGEGYDLGDGFSIRTAYEYCKQDGDTLIPKSDNFNVGIVNSASWLRAWSMHDLIVSAHYDCPPKYHWPVSPQVSFYAKFPVGGRRSLMMPTIGGQVAINF